MPQKGWGITDKNSIGNHTDPGSMNMVRAIQAAMGVVSVDGQFGRTTKNELNYLFGNQGVEGTKFNGYVVGLALLNKLLQFNQDSEYRLKTLLTAARFHPGFQPQSSTHCNQAAEYVARGMGIPDNLFMSANDQYTHITNPANGWIEVTPEQAQELANMGIFVIGVRYNSLPGSDGIPHGHSVVVKPGEYDGDRPSMLSMGRTPYLTGIEEHEKYIHPAATRYFWKY